VYNKIMVPLDGSKLAECVLPHVDGFVRGSQVEIIIFVRVIEPISTGYSERSNITVYPAAYKDMKKYANLIEGKKKSSAEIYLKEVVGRLKQNGVKYRTEVLVGKVADRLIDYVETNGIDLVLIATHGRSGVSRWVRGSIADRVLRSSRVPVLMVRAKGKMSLYVCSS